MRLSTQLLYRKHKLYCLPCKQFFLAQASVHGQVPTSCIENKIVYLVNNFSLHRLLFMVKMRLSTHLLYRKQNCLPCK